MGVLFGLAFLNSIVVIYIMDVKRRLDILEIKNQTQTDRIDNLVNWMEKEKEEVIYNHDYCLRQLGHSHSHIPLKKGDPKD